MDRRTWIDPPPVDVPADFAAAIGGHPLAQAGAMGGEDEEEVLENLAFDLEQIGEIGF